MTWNYRVCHRPTIPGGGYSIHEVYYDEEGRVTMYSERPVAPFGDLPEELEMDMGHMIDAFNQEPLNLNYVDHLIKVRDKVVNSGKQKG